MTKRLLTVLCTLALTVSLVFAQGAVEAKKTTSEGPVTLKVMNYIDMSEPNSMNEVSMIWDKFNELHPEIKVEREDLFNEPFHQKVEAYVASGNVPDVIYMWPGGRSTSLQTTHSVKDLRPLLEKDGLLNDYAPAALVDQTAGYLAELPNGITSSHMMYANTKVLRDNGLSIPKTYAELKAMVPTLKAKGIEVVGMANMDSWVMQSCLFSLVVGRMGGADWYEQLASGKINFNDPWFVKSLELISDMYKSGVLNQNTLNIGYGSNRGDFATGKCAFYIDGDWSAAAFQKDITTGQALTTPEQQQNDIELMVFPAIDGEVLHNSTSGVVGTGWGMSASIEAGSAKEAAAWTLIKFLEGEYAQTYRLTTGASFPSNLKVDVAKVIKDNNLEPIVGKRAVFYTRYATSPVIDGVLHSDVYNIINTGLQEIGLGSKTPAQVASETQKAWEAFNANN